MKDFCSWLGLRRGERDRRGRQGAQDRGGRDDDEHEPGARPRREARAGEQDRVARLQVPGEPQQEQDQEAHRLLQWMKGMVFICLSLCLCERLNLEVFNFEKRPACLCYLRRMLTVNWHFLLVQYPARICIAQIFARWYKIVKTYTKGLAERLTFGKVLKRSFGLP